MRRLLIAILIAGIAMTSCTVQKSCPTYAQDLTPDPEAIRQAEKEARIGYAFLTAGLIVFAGISLRKD